MQAFLARSTALVAALGLNVLAVGGLADGASADDAAFVKAYTMGQGVIVPAVASGGAFRITQSATWPSGRIYTFLPGAQIYLAAGVTLTIRGVVNADLASRIFTGPGKVIGIRQVYPEWWGAKADYGFTDLADAWDAAHTCVMGCDGSDGGWPTITMAWGVYGTTRRLRMAPSGTVPVRLVGQGAGQVQGTWLQAKASGGSIDYVLQLDAQDQAVADRVAGTGLRDFRVTREAGSNAQGGILLGSLVSGKAIIGPQARAMVSNVAVYEFPICWTISQARLFTFEDCTAWSQDTPGGLGMRITCPKGANNFTGDLVFNRFQFVSRRAPAGQANRVNLRIDSDGGSIRGLRALFCEFYGGNIVIDLSATGGANMGDYYFINPQFDGPSGLIFNARIDGVSTTCDDISVKAPYIKSADKVVRVVQTSGQFSTFRFDEGEWFDIHSGTDPCVEMHGRMSGISISGNIMEDVVTTHFAGVIAFFDIATDLRTSGNTIRSRLGSTAPRFATFGGSCDAYRAADNGAPAGVIVNGTAGVLELNPTARKAVGLNIF